MSFKWSKRVHEYIDSFSFVNSISEQYKFLELFIILIRKWLAIIIRDNINGLKKSGKVLAGRKLSETEWWQLASKLRLKNMSFFFNGWNLQEHTTDFKNLLTFKKNTHSHDKQSLAPWNTIKIDLNKPLQYLNQPTLVQHITSKRTIKGSMSVL